MTEAEWLVTRTPEPMLDHLEGTSSDRKLRLFLIECVLRVLPESVDEAIANTLAVAAKYADGKASRPELSRCSKLLRDTHQTRHSTWPLLYNDHIRSVPAWHVTRQLMTKATHEGARGCAWSRTRPAKTYPHDESAAQSDLLRCIFGNPFRPVTFATSWRSETTVALASAIYDERAFDRLPILADALEEAGCDHPDVLSHCRGPGPHARGCWVVDGVLGKE